MPQQYVIGIDLGTTNCALAYATASSDAREMPPVALSPVPQLVNPGELRDESLLPSFLYIPGPADFPEGSIALPWDESPRYVIGTLAQKRGAEVASRLVSSAKSWLSHSGVDRTAPILPPHAPEGIQKISSVEASQRYLEHLRAGLLAEVVAIGRVDLAPHHHAHELVHMGFTWAQCSDFAPIAQHR